ncbi:hypothetical protein [Mucilaginibacter roseus]|nr:hypothetical protein [Mucilaginibacter roseus]
MSTIEKQTAANNLPATSCPVKGSTLARLVLLRALLIPVGLVI